EPGTDANATRRALMDLGGVGDGLATTIVMRALHWPDAFPDMDRALQRSADVGGARELVGRGERGRPWRGERGAPPCAAVRARGGRGGGGGGYGGVGVWVRSEPVGVDAAADWRSG